MLLVTGRAIKATLRRRSPLVEDLIRLLTPGVY